MKVFSVAEKPVSHKEKFATGKRLVERAGYIPIKTRIENIMVAGEKLLQARKEQYDYGDDTDIDSMRTDPTRAVGFDDTDAQEILEDLQARRDYARRNQEVKKIEPLAPDSVVKPEPPPAGG